MRSRRRAGPARGTSRSRARPARSRFHDLRQYSYMPRISVSVTMWSVLPTLACRRARSSVRWKRLAARSLPATSSITSPSSAETKPAVAEQVGLAQPAAASSLRCRPRSRSASRQNRRRHGHRAGCGASKPLLTCCWKMTLGKIVVITAVRATSTTASGTMSRKRGSSQLPCLSLKLATCVTCSVPCSDLPALPRVETIAAWRWRSSITSCDLLSARQRPKVTNQVCSRPGW